MKSKRFVFPIILLLILSIACNLTGAQVPTVVPTAAVSASETPVPSLPPAATETPQVVFDGKLTCTPAGAFTKCLDGLLRIEFEYPTAWGVLSANLRSGGTITTGSAYDYLFDGQQFSDSPPLVAGGRSKVFSEGRDGITTDFSGYIADDPDWGASCDATWHKSYALCQNINPNITWMIYFPDAAALCDPSAGGPGYTTTPYFRVEINLPDNPTINGFVVRAPFISEAFFGQIKSDLYPSIGLKVDELPTKCDAASQKKFDEQRTVYLEQIGDNSAEAGTQKNLDELFHFINSITFQ